MSVETGRVQFLLAAWWPRRGSRGLIGLLILAASVSAACGSGSRGSGHRAQRRDAPAPSGLEHIIVRNVVLRPGETVSIGFHPTTRPAKLAVTPGSSTVRVCPGDGTAWGEAWSAGDCRKFGSDGGLRLPGRSEHVSVAVVNQGPDTVAIQEVRLIYDQHDYLKFVSLPPVGPQARSAEIVVPLELLDNAALADASSTWAPDQPARLELINGAGEVLRSAQGTIGTGVPFLDIGRSVRSDDELALRIVNLGGRDIAPIIHIEISPARPFSD